MVEFGLAFSVFVIFVLIVIDLGLLIYNHNLFYHGVSKGARVASLGGDNADIRDAVTNEITPGYFPTVLMVANPERGVDIDPEEEILRADGTEVTVIMDAEFGMSMLWFGNLSIDFPIRSSSVIIQNNDQDRDGCVDALEGQNALASPTGAGDCNWNDGISPNMVMAADHDNDGSTDAYLFDGPDTDADEDTPTALLDDRAGEDTIAISYWSSSITGSNADSYAIYRPNGPGPNGPGTTNCDTFNEGLGTGLLGNVTWEECFGGEYHAPVLWPNGVEHPPQLFERVFPNQQVTQTPDQGPPTSPPEARYDTRVLLSTYDRDNDGWEDKFDASPTDATQH